MTNKNKEIKHRATHKSSQAGSRAKRNLYLVSVACLLNMSAYLSLEGLQSSLNSGTGTISLSALYISMVLSSLFLSPLVVRVLGCRKAMGFGTLGYSVYIIANMYPRSYTLIPAAVILGTGSGVLWPSSRVYISNIACLHAESKDTDDGKTTGYFFGLFGSISSFAYIPGNLVASITFLLFNTSNSTSTVTTHFNESYSAFVVSKCGLHDCEIYLNERNDSSTATEDSSAEVDRTFLTLLFLGYLAVNITAVLILLLAVEDVSHVKSGKAEISDKCGNEVFAVELQPLSLKPIDTKTLENNFESTKCNEGSQVLVTQSSTEKKSTNLTKEVFATTLFIVRSHTSKLLIIESMHLGQIQSFTLGIFTRHWLKCSLGIVSVGFILMSFGVCCVIGGAFIGYLLRWLSRSVVAIGASVIVVCVSVFLLLWEPSAENQLPFYIFTCSCFGLVLLTYITLLTSTFSILFSDDKASALAAFTVWNSLGTSIFYALSSFMCNRTALFLMIAVSIVGNTLYVIAEHSHKKSKSK